MDGEKSLRIHLRFKRTSCMQQQWTEQNISSQLFATCEKSCKKSFYEFNREIYTAIRD